MKFAFPDSTYSSDSPGDIVNNKTIKIGSLIKNISYDIQMSMTNYDSSTNVSNKDILVNCSCYVWPITIGEAEAEALVKFAPTFFEFDGNGDFSVKSLIDKTWSNLMSEMLKPEVVSILGKPMMFLPTTVSDAEKIKTYSVPKRLQIVKKKNWHGWMIFWDCSDKFQGDSPQSFDELKVACKVRFNEYRP